MTRVCIGVHFDSQPRRLSSTFASLHSNTPHDVELLLLPDGADDATLAVLSELSELSELPLSGNGETRGPASCFNRLAAVSDADVLVLLEGGAQVAPSWLEHLLAALDDDPRNGLAGPTTNYSWNEQGIYPHTCDTPEAITRTAREAFARFGREARLLEPLHSLADFCYTVRRETFEAVGLADETYGPGPCWEMDYNVRAARAGWRGVWACASYVHRAPATARHRRAEAALFEINKRLYQDKFCGARLRGEKSDYRSHCRGDACPNFAPAELIQINCPSVPATTTATHDGVSDSAATTRPVSIGQTRVPTSEWHEYSQAQAAMRRVRKSSSRPAAQGFARRPRVQNSEGQHRFQTYEAWPRIQSVESQLPLVTCIMPTCDRRPFVAQSIRYFLRQDYPSLELLILDDGRETVADLVPDDARVRYFHSDEKLCTGAKRNAACEQARGSVIVHWDDDDWYPSWRVRAQVSEMLEHGADISGTSRLFYFDAANDRAWEYSYKAAGSPWVAGNTLAYRKEFWEHNRFPEVQVGEDSLFVWSGSLKSIRDLADPRLCVASVHAGNTSPKETDGAFWQELPTYQVHELLGDDLYLYRALFPPTTARAWPLVSCIMPTFNRRAFVPLAVSNFLAQDYPEKELLVIDDGDDAVADLLQDLPGVRYTRLRERASIGAKRNAACEQARGSVIVHWDDDDWYAPDRLRYQVHPLVADEADLTGLENSFVLELPGGAFWTTQPHLHRQMFVGDVHGGTLAYRRELLADGLRYPEINLAEDAWLLHYAVQRGKRLLRLPNPGLFVYVRHGHNAWGEFAPGSFINPEGWLRVAPPHTFTHTHLDCYQTAAANL